MAYSKSLIVDLYEEALRYWGYEKQATTTKSEEEVWIHPVTERKFVIYKPKYGSELTGIDISCVLLDETKE